MAKALMLDPMSTIDPTVIDRIVGRIAGRIPPLWDLPNLVAVNPFLGFAGTPLPEAARTVGDALDAHVLPSVEHYRRLWAEGSISEEDLIRAAERDGVDPEPLREILDGRSSIVRRTVRQSSAFVERDNPNLNRFILRSISRWCSVYATKGGSWKLASADRGLFGSWIEAARVDRSVEAAGGKNWRRRLKSLPDSASEAIGVVASRLNIAEPELEKYLESLLRGLHGWASALRRRTWESGENGPGAILDLLAIRAAADYAASTDTPTESLPQRSEIRRVEDEETRVILQTAWEDGYARSIADKFNPPPVEPLSTRPAAQAVFCIDVRSERLRRRLEEVDPSIETLGFAGFFGVPLNWSGEAEDSARCPVLLKPNVTLEAPGESKPSVNVSPLKTAPAASFSYVEILGPAHALSLLLDSMSLRSEPVADERHAHVTLDAHDACGIDPETRFAIARGILKNIGLGGRFGRLILLCGHEGRSANNPQAAGLHCGACGGHGGALNARVAAAILNDLRVRERLAATGSGIPTDTWFVAGIHDTSTDEVELLDLDRLPVGHSADARKLAEALAEAGMRVRSERAAVMGIAQRSDQALLKAFRRRSRDWAQVRPEWALARNAAFIAARRSRTKGVDLDGRTFLHEYDRDLDQDGSVLGLILAAPMIVASWINLQYFASTVDNERFGAGHKALQQRVGSVGVILGNGGDLQTGLSLQSVVAPDGTWFHEPLRLQVFIEADPTEIDRALEKIDSARNLVENGWIRLYSLYPDRPGSALRLADGGWEEV